MEKKLNTLLLMPYSSKESNFEHEEIEADIDTHYHRLNKGRSIVISLGGIHNIVVGSDVDNPEKVPFNRGHLSAIMANGIGHKRQKSKLPLVIGITNSGKSAAPKTLANTQWKNIDRFKQATTAGITFVYEGAPAVVAGNSLADIADYQGLLATDTAAPIIRCGISSFWCNYAKTISEM